MYWSQLNMTSFKAIQGSIDTVIIPIGTTEAHGPHLPLGTDFMIPNHIASKLENNLGDKIIIAPPVNYGCSWNLGFYPGTINISGETMTNYIFEICQGFLKWGILNIVFLNGHGGNRPALQLAAQKAADQGAKVLLINWWIDYAEQIATICSGKGHAGEDETSAVLAIAADLVDMSLAKANWNKLRGQIFTKDISKLSLAHALTGDGSLGTIEKGRKIYDVVTKEIEELLEHFMAGDYLESSV